MKKIKRITAFDVINTALVAFVAIVALYPLYFCVIASFSSPTEVTEGHTLLWIKGFTLDHYRYILRENALWVGYKNTIIYTFFGTIYNLLMTIPAAYALSKPNLPFKKAITWYFFVTMYFGGGLVPQYMLIKQIGLLDNPLSCIIGTGISCSNLIITRQYFSSNIPSEIYESAQIDGSGEWCSFWKIALPLSKPIIAVMSLYYGVTRWNSYYNALLYLRSDKYKPLQLVLREILINNSISVTDMGAVDVESAAYAIQRANLVEGMKYAIIFVACLPLLMAFPFMQKYFRQGVMVGSLKG